MKEKWNGDALKWFRFFSGFVDPACFFPFQKKGERARCVCIGHKMKCHFNDVLLASIDKFTFIIYPCNRTVYHWFFSLSFKFMYSIGDVLFVVVFLLLHCLRGIHTRTHSNLRTKVWCCFLTFIFHLNWDFENSFCVFSAC